MKITHFHVPANRHVQTNNETIINSLPLVIAKSGPSDKFNFFAFPFVVYFDYWATLSGAQGLLLAVLRNHSWQSSGSICGTGDQTRTELLQSKQFFKDHANFISIQYKHWQWGHAGL